MRGGGKEQSEPLEGKRRMGAVAQKAFEPRTVTGRDVNGGTDAEPAGGVPGELVVSDVAFEQTVAVEVTERAMAHGGRQP